MMVAGRTPNRMSGDTAQQRRRAPPLAELAELGLVNVGKSNSGFILPGSNVSQLPASHSM